MMAGPLMLMTAATAMTAGSGVAQLPAFASRGTQLPAVRRTATTRLTAAIEDDVGAAAKGTILSILASSPNLAATSPASTQIMELSEAVLALSRINPTDVPARSALINGVWELAWAQTPGAGLADSPTRPLALALYSTGCTREHDLKLPRPPELPAAPSAPS